MEIVSRKSALELGLPTYFTGKPCKNGLIAPRTARWAKCQCLKCKADDSKSSIRYYQQNTAKCQARNKRQYEKDQEARKEYAKQQHWANKDRANEYSRAYYRENSDRIKKLAREYTAANRASCAEKSRIRSAEHYRNNPDKYLDAFHRRRAAKLRAIPSWYGELDDFVMREAHELCRTRRLATGTPWHVDHAVPLQGIEASGLHCAHNIQVIPSRLNIAKGNRLIYVNPFEWLQQA